VKYLVAFLGSLLLLTTVASAPDEPFLFEDAKKQERFNSLMEEIRCLVCQNQSLADSGAGLADDLRKEAYRMISEGQSNDAIKAFMVERYGDFVLYDPPLQPSTFVLWFGPFILMLVATIVIIAILKKRNQPS
tara:strand:- start:994 stop:1392 length:399 start_codon:yes stop_codon:yes gene_type:complete